MCSVVDGAFMEEVETTETVTKTVCQKCKTEKPSITLRKKDVYCKSCFLVNCNHKFRSTLGKNKAIKINDRVLVAFSGSQGSLALLKLIRNSFDDENNPKKITYSPHILIIDESSSSNSDFQFQDVKSLAEKFNFPLFTVHLAKVLDLDDGKVLDSIPSDKCKDDLMKLLNESSDESCKVTLMKSLRTKLITEVAKEIQCCKIFSGECATSLAVTLLSGKLRDFFSSKVTTSTIIFSNIRGGCRPRCSSSKRGRI